MPSKAFRVQWTPLARQDLEEAATYIRRDSPAAAKRFYAATLRRTVSLKAYPMLGRIVPEEGNELLRELIQ